KVPFIETEEEYSMSRKQTGPSTFAVTVKNATMRELCDDLSGSLGAPLLDLTGIGAKKFNVDFQVLYYRPGSMEETLVENLRKSLGVVIHRSKAPIRTF